MSKPPDLGSLLPDTPQFHAERDRLDAALRDEFDRLVEAYRFHAFHFYQRPFVSYRILAALVRDGWRLVRDKADPIPEGELSKVAGTS
jgi:hypothetical protein